MLAVDESEQDSDTLRRPLLQPMGNRMEKYPLKLDAPVGRHSKFDVFEKSGTILCMLSLALLPLVCYFAFLMGIHVRKTPTVLNGSLDVQLLTWGLFGLLSFGPGRLVIPLYVFTAWGIYTWVFWFGFYFVGSLILARQFRNRLVVYHCQQELVLPAFFTLAKQMDPKAEWSGYVLSLHSLGVQWSVTHNRWGGYMVFVPTHSPSQSPHLEMVQTQLKNLCRTLEMPKQKILWFWGTLTFGLSCLAIGQFIGNFSGFVQQFSDHWFAM